MTRMGMVDVHGVATVPEIVKLFKVTKMTVMNHIYRGKISARQSGKAWLVSLSEANTIYQVRDNVQVQE